MARPLASSSLCIADRLMVAIKSLLFWALVYSYCGLCAFVELLKLLWRLGTRPGKTFQWLIRENPPGCLNDPSLGTHCYVRIKVTRSACAGEGRGWRRKADSGCQRPTGSCLDPFLLQNKETHGETGDWLLAASPSSHPRPLLPLKGKQPKR